MMQLRRIHTNLISFGLGEAYLKAATLATAASGFRATGISPLNPTVFTEADFRAAAPTDVPLVEEGPPGLANAAGAQGPANVADVAELAVADVADEPAVGSQLAETEPTGRVHFFVATYHLELIFMQLYMKKY